MIISDGDNGREAISTLKKLAAIVTKNKEGPLPPEMLAEKTVQAVLDSRNVKEKTLEEGEKEYLCSICVVLLRKYENKIETLIEKILRLAMQVYTQKIATSLADIFLLETSKICKNESVSVECQVEAMRLIGKVVSGIGKEDFMRITPGIFGLILASILGNHSFKETYINETSQTFKVFIQKFFECCLIEVKEVFVMLESSRKTINVQKMMLSLPNLSNIKISNPSDSLKKELLPYKQVIDKLFEGLFRLDTSPHKQKLFSSNSKSYLQLFSFLSNLISPYQYPPILDLLSDLTISTLSDSSFSPEKEHILSTISPQKLVSRLENEISSLASKQHLLSEIKAKTSLSISLCNHIISCRGNPQPPKISAQDIIRLVRFSCTAIQYTDTIPIDTFDDIDAHMTIDSHTHIMTSIYDMVVHRVKDNMDCVGFDQDICEMLLDLVCLLLSTMHKRGKNSDSTVLGVVAVLEEFNLYIHEVCAMQRRGGEEKLTVGIEGFSSSIKRYATVEEPLNDLCSALLVVLGMVRKGGWRRGEEYDLGPALDGTLEETYGQDAFALEELVQQIKGSVDIYLDCAKLNKVKRKAYKTTINSLILAVLFGAKERQFTETPDTRGLALSGINSYVFGLLSTEDGGEPLVASLVSRTLRCAAYRISCFPVHLGLAPCSSLASVSGFLQAFSPFLTEQSKFTILNYPSSPAAVQCLTVLSRITNYTRYLNIPFEDIYNITMNMLKFVDVLIDKYQSSSFDSKNLKVEAIVAKMFGDILTTSLINKATLLKDCEELVKDDKVAPSNFFRKIGLKVYPRIANCKSGELLETHWSNLRMLIEVLDKVPMFVEDHTAAFSGNEPANCVIESSSGPFVVEIWKIIIEEVEKTAKNYIRANQDDPNSLAYFVYEFAIMKSRTRETHLKAQLQKWVTSFFPGPAAIHWKTKLAETNKEEMEAELNSDITMDDPPPKADNTSAPESSGPSLPRQELPLTAKSHYEATLSMVLSLSRSLSSSLSSHNTLPQPSHRYNMVHISSILTYIESIIPSFYSHDRLSDSCVYLMLTYVCCSPSQSVDHTKNTINIVQLLSRVRESLPPPLADSLKVAREYLKLHLRLHSKEVPAHRIMYVRSLADLLDNDRLFV